ncbi:MAG: SAM-dependent methyltransferase [Phycisphaerae bacterium]
MIEPHSAGWVPGRGYHKLAAALEAFGLDPAGWVCADLGSHVGGFVCCLLRRGAARVYAIETGYGVLDYALRRDPRVVVMERTNALRVRLPEPVDLVTIDVGWTRQRHILPAARKMLKTGGRIISLVKPHYEADRRLLRRGVLPAEHLAAVIEQVTVGLGQLGLLELGRMDSPLPGQAGNRELFLLLAPTGEAGQET